MKTIEVYANPYCALDKDGIPQGVMPMPGAPTSYIGAQLDLALTLKTGKQRFYFPIGRNGGKFKAPLTAEISTAVRDGALIAADKQSAHYCGVRASYLEPEKALEAEKAKALADRRAQLGPDATVGEVPREPTKFDDEKSAPAPATAAQVSPTVKLTKNKEA